MTRRILVAAGLLLLPGAARAASAIDDLLAAEARLPGLPPKALYLRPRLTPTARSELEKAWVAHRVFEGTLDAHLAFSPKAVMAAQRAGRGPFHDGSAARVPPLPRLQALADRLRFLAWCRFHLEDPVDALRARLRTLRLGLALLDVADSDAALGRALALANSALLGTARMLLTGDVPRGKVTALGKILRAYRPLLPEAGALAAAVGRAGDAFTRSLRDRGLDPAVARRAATVFREHAREASRLLRELPAREADAAIESRALGIIRDHRAALGALKDAPFFRGHARELARLWALRALAEGAALLAYHRGGEGAWPDPARVTRALPADPFTEAPIGYRRIDGEPALASVGLDGKDDGFRTGADILVASHDLMARAEEFFPYVKELSLPRLGDLALPPRSALAKVPQAAADDCAAARADLEARVRALETRRGLAVRDDPRAAYLLLLGADQLPEIPRCPRDGLWAVRAGRWICSAHPAGPDAAAGAGTSASLARTCRDRRIELARGIVRYEARQGPVTRRVDPDFQQTLMTFGYLRALRACPRGGAYDYGAAGITCDAHGSLAKVAP